MVLVTNLYAQVVKILPNKMEPVGAIDLVELSNQWNTKAARGPDSESANVTYVSDIDCATPEKHHETAGSPLSGDGENKANILIQMPM